MPLPAAVLWDMDGTLVDTEPYWMAAEKSSSSARSAAPGPTTTDSLLVGLGLWNSAGILQSRGVDLEPDEIVTWLTDRVPEAARRGRRAVASGRAELLGRAARARASRPRSSRCRCAGWRSRSSSQHPVRRLRRRSSAATRSTEPKPHPEAYLRAARAARRRRRDTASPSRTRWPASPRRSPRARDDRRAAHRPAARDGRAHALGHAGGPHRRRPRRARRARRTAAADERPELPQSSGPFRAGDRVQLTGPKGR